MALDLFHSGNRAQAVDTFLQTVAGPDYRAVIDKVLPDAIAQAEADAETFFGIELPALSQWSFTEDDARRVRQPVRQVLGADSQAIFAARHELLLSWLPNAEPYVLPEATHLLYLQNPTDVAVVLVAPVRLQTGRIPSARILPSADVVCR